jgi:hypothetical protein
MVVGNLDWAPGWVRPFVEAAIAAAKADPRVVGLTVGGSGASGTMDEFSDLDFVVVCRDQDHAGVLGDAPAFAARFGPLLSSFTGEHVREPRLLLCLFGPPSRRVDLMFVADRDLDRRVEDGRILWQRDGALDKAYQRAIAVWPIAYPQWIEDRFWTWIHNGATKLGRGELLACLEELAFLRRTVFGPLIAQSRGYRPSGVRRLELIAPDLVPALAATIGDHSAPGCARALRAAIDLYQRLRDESGDVARRGDAEIAALAYLVEIEARLVDEAG